MVRSFSEYLTSCGERLIPDIIMKWRAFLLLVACAAGVDVMICDSFDGPEHGMNVSSCLGEILCVTPDDVTNHKAHSE